ncbi:MAG: UTP--glucose-1-phosphate uridylyltransferase GalU [Gammaproteobacteria bacterium]|nr:UTP--glucose-1-phosphate uridylyltransferase GalU [Gammaproteobacteria bacterium]
MTKKVTKAVFPVAGLGTRFLPATKASPKEMLPVVDKPLIQYAAEEAIAAGITELIFVTSSSKRAIEDHFDSNFELESFLEAKGKTDLLKIVKNVLPEGITCSYVRQRQALGLGHAVLCAEQLVNNEAFAVLLADDLIAGEGRSCLAQMISVYETTQSSVIAVQKIDAADTDKYGIIGSDDLTQNPVVINQLVEKPKPASAPSNLAIVGRYILTPEIFAQLRQTKPGAGGEIQLTDAIAGLLKKQTIYGLPFKGKRYDCGSKIGYLEATLAFALQHPELEHDFKALLKQFVS